MVILDNADKAFCSGNRVFQILEQFSLSLNEASVIALLGPSGCGKSTLLRVLAGLEELDKGSVTVFGHPPLDHLRQGLTTILSSQSALVPWRTALGNLQLPLDLLARKSSSAELENSLAEVGLAKFGLQRPSELSDGQRQRLRLAQALITRPTLLLLDEPFSAVDECLRETLIELLLDYLQKSSASALMVTHYSEEAAAIADTILVAKPFTPGNGPHLRCYQPLTLSVPRDQRDGPQRDAFSKQIRGLSRATAVAI